MSDNKIDKKTTDNNSGRKVTEDSRNTSVFKGVNNDTAPLSFEFERKPDSEETAVKADKPDKKYGLPSDYNDKKYEGPKLKETASDSTSKEKD